MPTPASTIIPSDSQDAISQTTIPNQQVNIQISPDGLGVYFPDRFIFVSYSPNKDLVERIQYLEKRAAQMLPICLALMALIGATQSILVIYIISPFFLISFAFYLLSYTGTPSVSFEPPLMTVLKECEARIQAPLNPQDRVIAVNALSAINDKIASSRVLFRRNLDRKQLCSRIAHSSFFSFVLTGTLLLIFAKSGFLTDSGRALLFVILMAVLAAVFYLLHKAQDRQV